MNKTIRALPVLATLALVAVGAPAAAHHVGDKEIPGQDYQMLDEWLTERAHMNAPWDYVPVDVDGNPIEGSETTTTTNNERCEHLADSDVFDPINDNSSLHDTGEQFLHVALPEGEAWPAVTGRYALDADFGSPNSLDRGQQPAQRP